MTIHELDDETVRKIAAGEVVERPASVVKELVENSLDADADRIDVAVEAGGTEGIRVADDGTGMTREEAQMAVREHTTSKIEDAGDLDAIGTLGFRGEALYAIGSVSRTTIRTKPREGDEGTELRVEGGEVVAVGPAGRPGGTTVEVADLFFNTPAREKFLKSEATEFDHVNRVVSRYALANPGVATSLSHDGREIFSTTGQGDLRGAILSVYGREVAESMRPVEAESVSGYVSHPETNRSTREYVSTFVNGRYVRSGTLREAVISAYGDQLAPDRYPFAVLFLDVPPDAVDVNVHPRKTEVRFDDEPGVRETIREAVESALIEGGLVRSGAPRGRSAPEEASVEPEPAGGPDGEGADGPERPAPESTPSESPGSGERAESDAEATRDPGGEIDGRTTESRTTDRDGATDAHERPRLRESGTQTTLDSGAVETPGFDRLPPMRVLGQVADTYVVAESEGGLVLIDQHAADERVNYERLAERLREPGAQALAEPVRLELTAREAELFPAYADALSDIGFRAERVGEREVEVRAVPAVFADALDPDLLRDALAEAIRDREATSVEARADAVLADLACHPSITGNTSLTEGSVRRLLEALDGCENPYACPHGRPTVVEISADELDERFERDYPGHGGRRE